MTPERAKALEAVAEAARALFDGSPVLPLQALASAIDALDAEPADAGEMVDEKTEPVRVNIWRDAVGSLDADVDNLHRRIIRKQRGFVHVAVITARIPSPVVPEVRAEIET